MDKAVKILVIHGPNLNLLGLREPEIYGHFTLEELNQHIKEQALNAGLEVVFFQSNHEGEIIDRIHECLDEFDGIIINPGAFTHYSYAIRDALAAVGLPCVEVHLSDIYQRESFRRVSVIKDVCLQQFYGKGLDSYLEALRFLRDYLKQRH